MDVCRSNTPFPPGQYERTMNTLGIIRLLQEPGRRFISVNFRCGQGDSALTCLADKMEG